MRCVGDLCDTLIDFSCRGDNRVHCLASLTCTLAAVGQRVDGILYQVANFLCRLRASLRQRPHFLRYYTEALSLFARVSGFHRCIDRQDIGLERDRVHHADDFGHALRALIDMADGVDQLVDHRAAGAGATAGFMREPIGALRLTCNGWHRIGQRAQCALQGLYRARLLGDVGGVLHYLEWPAIHVEDRVVACLNPYASTAAADAPEQASVVFAQPQALPELTIGFAFAFVGIDKQLVVSTDDVFAPGNQRSKKIVVRVEDDAVEIEADHRLCAIDRGKAPFHVSGFEALGGDIDGVLDDFARPAECIENGTVAALNPDLAPALGDAFIDPALRFAGAQLAPECLVLVAFTLVWLDKHTVMLADDFVSAVAERREEIIVGRNDFAVQRKFDDRLCLVKGVDLALQLGARMTMPLARVKPCHELFHNGSRSGNR